MQSRRMQSSRPPHSLLLFTAAVVGCCLTPIAVRGQPRLRFATYNASLFGKVAGEIRERLADGADDQAEKVAAIVQTIRPDVLLINELDYDADGNTAKLLAEKFFAKPQGDRFPIEYPYVYSIPSNTGIDSGLDLDHNGKTGEAADAWGYGKYPGQYAMAVFSRYRIIEDGVRTFQNFLWKDLPAAKRPFDPETKKPYHDDATWNRLRLSSKNHVDVPVMVIGRPIHILVSHPTPPVFDGKEDRNGCRNHDEIKFWIDYLAGEEGKQAQYIVDDAGKRGGVDLNDLVVVMGDLNADPADGDGDQRVIDSLLSHSRLQDPLPISHGAVEAKMDDAGKPDRDTASFRSANMRVDYVLPDRRIYLRESRVFWPPQASEDHRLITDSDHRMVWIKVEIP